MKKFLPMLIISAIIGLSTLTLADSATSINSVTSITDDVFFSQVVGDQKTVFLVKADGTDQRALVSGKNIKVFLIRKHMLYYTDHQLFEYLPVEQKSKLLTRFNEDEIFIQDLAGKTASQSETPDQAVILAETPYEQNVYVLEFSDGSIRSVSESLFSSSASNANSASSIKISSPDQTAVAVVQQAGMKLRFELLIQEKVKDKPKTSWTLPQNMTVIPELPIWSPNSHSLAFYARSFDQLTGFYSLYLYDLEKKELRMIQEQVFSTMSLNSLSMGPFRPEWSQDGKYLIFQYRPYGLPTESLILKYDAVNDKKTTLTSSCGHNLYPTWSPSGKSILFLSNREAIQDQVYIMDDKGEHLRRLSPPNGYTEWASWYKAE
jgi:hypothetical protein